MIRKENGKFVILNHDGTKKLGEYATREEAEKRLRQIEAFKYMAKKGGKWSGYCFSLESVAYILQVSM